MLWSQLNHIDESGSSYFIVLYFVNSMELESRTFFLKSNSILDIYFLDLVW